MDVIDLFERGTAWSGDRVAASAAKLDAPTPCDEWDVRTLLNHMVDSLRYFTEAANDPQNATLPSPNPPDVVGDDPEARYAAARDATLAAYREPGVLDRTGPSLGIAFVDQLVHGWDLAEATGQDATMPADLAEAAFKAVDGRMPPDRRGSAFKPEVPVPDDASGQERLLGYVGRKS